MPPIAEKEAATRQIGYYASIEYSKDNGIIFLASGGALIGVTYYEDASTTSGAKIAMNPIQPFEQEIEAFKDIEEDEDMSSTHPLAIYSAIKALNHIHYTDNLLPSFTVPTRSGGVGLEYNLDTLIVYYRFDEDGTMSYVVMEGTDVLINKNFDDANTVLTPTQLLEHAI